VHPAGTGGSIFIDCTSSGTNIFGAFFHRSPDDSNATEKIIIVMSRIDAFNTIPSFDALAGAHPKRCGVLGVARIQKWWSTPLGGSNLPQQLHGQKQL